MGAREELFLASSPLLGDRAKTVYERFLTVLHLEGDVAECGVFAGHTSLELVRYLETMHMPKRVHMFDTFAGLPPIITDRERSLASGNHLEVGRLSCSLSEVVDRMGNFKQYRIHRGLFSTTFAGFDEPLCFIHADSDLYESTVDIIGLANRCLVPGGCIVFDDYDNPSFPGVTLAIEDQLDHRYYDVIECRQTLQCLAIRREAAAEV